MQDIIFYNYKEVTSPRIHDENNYQNNIKLRLKQMVSSHFFRNYNLEQKEMENFRKYKSQKGFNRSVTRPINEICISDSIQSIRHDEERAKIYRKKQKENVVEGDNTSIKRFKFNPAFRRSEIRIPIHGNIKLPDIKEKTITISEGTEESEEFDIIHSEFILSNMFGYQ